MANTDGPRGAWPIRHLTGGVIRNNEYPIADAYNTSIFTGDFVKLVAGGTIEVAGAGDRVIGVFAGCEYVNSAGEQVFSKYWPASTSVLSGTTPKALVFDDRNIEFGIQCDGSLAAADVGQLADIVTTHSGSTTTGKSGQEISATTGTGDAQLRILGKIEDPENDWDSNVDVRVQIYEHEFTNADHATPGV